MCLAAPEEMAMKPPALTLEQVQQRLNVGRTRVYALLKSGQLRRFKEGRDWRVDEADLEAYIESRKQGGSDSVSRPTAVAQSFDADNDLATTPEYFQ
jgi:excisionase family DNA binding protein